MARKLRPRKGTTAQNNAYTGAAAEITIDTTKKTLVVHDGATAGGNPLPTFADVTTTIYSLSGVPSGIAGLDGDGKVPSAQLPSYVDDVLEYANLAAFPGTGETGKIYLAQDTGASYRWTGTVYIKLSDDDVLEFANLAAFPVSGAGAALYIAADTGLLYRWNGAAYVSMGLSAIPTMTMLGNNTGGAAVPVALDAGTIRALLMTAVSDWAFPAGATFASGISSIGWLVKDSLGVDAAYATGNNVAYQSFNIRGITYTADGMDLRFKNGVTEMHLTTSGGDEVLLDTYGRLVGSALYGLTCLGSNGGEGFTLNSSGVMAKYSSTFRIGSSGNYTTSMHVNDITTYAVYIDWSNTYTPASGDTVSSYESHIKINPAANLAALTISLIGGAAPATGKEQTFYFTKDVTALTVTGHTTVVGAPTSVSAGDSFTMTLTTGVWLCTASSHSNAAKAMTHDASGGGTLVVPSNIRSLKLTGALPAAFTADCSALPDGAELTIYSVNGVTALTISGGTNLGTLTTLAAAGIGQVKRCLTELIVK